MGGLCLRFLETKVLAGHFQKQPVGQVLDQRTWHSKAAQQWDGRK